MSPKLLLGAVSAVLGAAAVLFFLSSSDRTDGPASETASIRRDARASADTDAAGPAQLSGVDAPGSPAETGRSALTTATSRATLDLRSNIPDSRRIQLRVEVQAPLGAPIDEDLVVAAWSDEEVDEGSFDWRSERSRRRFRRRSSVDDAIATFHEAEDDAEVRWSVGRREPDGTFTVALDREARQARVTVGGRFLYLRSPEEVDLERVPERLVLEPELGTWIVGRLDGLDGEPSGTVRLSGGTMGTGRRGGGGRRRGGMDFVDRRVPLDPDGRFEFRGVRSDLNVEVIADLPSFAPGRDAVEGMAPSGRVDLVIALQPGGAIEGRVVDPSGHPVADAEVTATDPSRGMFGRGAPERSATSGSDGAFRIVGLDSGTFRVRATRPDWRDGRPAEDVDVEVGSTRVDVLVTMDPGLVIRGRASLSNGTDASGATVRLEQAGERQATRARGPWGRGRTNNERQETTCAADGSFEFRALAEGPARLAFAYVDAASGKKYASLREDVAPRQAQDAKSIEIELAPTLAIAGRVVDDRGEPIRAFEIRAAREGYRSSDGIGDGVRETFASDDGTFSLAGVTEGTWTVMARAEGHRSPDAEERTVVVPDGGAALTFALPRDAGVRGTVLTPEGAPASGANVALVSSGRGFGPWGGPQGVETDADGAFELGELEAGTLRIRATHDEWAPSDETTVEVAPGTESAGVVVTLRRGGTIRGIVRNDDGEAWPGRRVMYSSGSGPMAMFGAEDTVTTDAAGEFEFRAVPAGEWTITAAPSERETFQTMREARDESAFFAMMARNLTSTVAVEEGGEAWVELGAEPREPVVVFGTVTRAGSALTDGSVTYLLEGAELFSNLRRAPIADDGTYRLELDRPGAYLVSVERAGTRNGFMRDVDRDHEQQIDLALPEGGVSGRVRTPDGEPAAGERVTIEHDTSFALARFDPRSATTDAEGRYEILDLDPGRYTLRVGGRRFGPPGSGRGGSKYARTSVDGITVSSDAMTTGVDVRLSGSGRVLGRVVDASGEPVSGATIFVRAGDGRSVDSISTVRTDASGSFTYDRIAPGAYVVTARTTDGAACDKPDVRVVENEDVEVELRVDAATTLVITTIDEEDEPVRANLSVTDRDGREVAGLVGVDVFRTMGAGMSTSEQRVGPLPPGRYTVKATTMDGREVKKKVTVRGKAESRVRVRFKARE